MASPNPNGRPPKAREMAKLAILHEIVGNQEWRAIFRQMLLDALGMISVPDPANPRVERDPNSTAHGRATAQKNLLAYAIGLPTQIIKVADGEGDVFEQFSNMSEAQIESVLAELERVQSAIGIEGGAPTGTQPKA